MSSLLKIWWSDKLKLLYFRVFGLSEGKKIFENLPLGLWIVSWAFLLEPEGMGMESMPKRYSTSEGPGLSMKFSAAMRASSCLMGIFLWTERMPLIMFSMTSWMLAMLSVSWSRSGVQRTGTGPFNICMRMFHFFMFIPGHESLLNAGRPSRVEVGAGRAWRQSAMLSSEVVSMHHLNAAPIFLVSELCWWRRSK